MAGIWAVADVVAGQPTRLTLELATLAAGLAAETGVQASVVLVGGDPDVATQIAAHGPGVRVIAALDTASPGAANTALVVDALMAQDPPDVLLIGDAPEGKDVAGTLVGLTDLPILVAGSAVTEEDGAPSVEASTFGGRLVTSSRFHGGRGIVLVRSGAISAQPAAQPGPIEDVAVPLTRSLPAVVVIDSVVEAATGPSIDDARVIVGAGRGVGGPEGLPVIAELAGALDGAVGATRAAVDSGWIDFAQQIGQTGKIVKPELYIACGISGAIQHKVGVQSAATIVAINKDPDAPIAEFADVVVVGDLFEIVPRLTAAVRDARAGG